jgi:hypothetical protein
MTLLFRMKNQSHETSIESSFVNIKEKLDEYNLQNVVDKN